MYDYNLPGSTAHSQSTKKCPIFTKAEKPLDHLDKMMDDILESDMSAMCPFNFTPMPHQQPTSSKSDGQLCKNNK